MILASCIDTDAGPGAKGAHAVISLADGGIRFALHSSSLVFVFRMVSSSTWSSLRTIPSLRAYIHRTAPTEGTSYTLQGLIAWKDLLRSLEVPCASPGSWEVASIRKTRTAHPAHLLFRQVLLFVVGQLLVPHPQTNALNGPIRAPSCALKQSKEMTIPHIVITPPSAAPSRQASVNTVPMPQDAAFGNQLTVPDPEFTVINCWKSPEYPYIDTFRMDEFSSVANDPFGGFGGYAGETFFVDSCPPSWGDLENADNVVECVSWQEREEDDIGALGPTWSG